MRTVLEWLAARVIPIGFGAAASIIALLPAAAPAQVQWHMATEYPATSISGVGLTTFAKLLDFGTHGFVTTVNGLDNEMKISSGDMSRATQDHRIDGGDAFAGPLEIADPVFGLATLPFVVQSIEAAKAVNTRARPLYERALAARGLKLLYITIWPSTGLWSDQALTSAEDLRKLSVRAYDGSSAEVMRNVGAATELLPFNEAIVKVRDHRLNAILSSGDGGAGRKLWDDLHHFTPINYAIPISVAFVRQDAFAALPRGHAGPGRSRRRRDRTEPVRAAHQSHRRELPADARQRRQHRRAGAAGGHRRAQESRLGSDRRLAARAPAEAVAILDWANRQ